MENSELIIKEGYKQTEIGEIPEDWADGELFVKTILLFLEKEHFILIKDLNERTIAHKLAQYLDFAFADYDVDCEYNRMNGTTEDGSSKYYSKELDLRLDEELERKDLSVFPDIIVHKRGIDDKNYLIIEIKKTKYADDIRKDKATGKKETYRDFDKRKLRAYIRELNYELGIYIEFAGADICELYFEK